MLAVGDSFWPSRLPFRASAWSNITGSRKAGLAEHECVEAVTSFIHHTNETLMDIVLEAMETIFAKVTSPITDCGLLA